MQLECHCQTAYNVASHHAEEKGLSIFGSRCVKFCTTVLCRIPHRRMCHEILTVREGVTGETVTCWDFSYDRLEPAEARTNASKIKGPARVAAHGKARLPREKCFGKTKVQLSRAGTGADFPEMSHNIMKINPLQFSSSQKCIPCLTTVHQGTAICILPLIFCIQTIVHVHSCLMGIYVVCTGGAQEKGQVLSEGLSVCGHYARGPLFSRQLQGSRNRISPVSPRRLGLCFCSNWLGHGNNRQRL